MSYATAANRPNPAAMAGALGVPGAFAALLVFGLAVTVVTPEPDEIINAWNIDDPVPPPPPDPVEPQSTSQTTQQTTQVPEIIPTRPDSPFEFDFNETGAVTELPGLESDLGPIGPVDFGIPDVGPPAPTFDPVSASPRGRASEWITNDDYRASWINRGLEGRASFALSIDARGRVTDCRITGSTGHSVLDQATCRLLERRARFDPAKDSSGNAVPGTYSNSVTWQIPE